MTLEERIKWTKDRLTEDKITISALPDQEEKIEFIGRIKAWDILLDSLVFEQNNFKFTKTKN